MKSFSATEIQAIIHNSTDFKQAIIDSKGFILYLADKYTIDLPPHLLIETINPYSIRFIVEHIKSHKYTEEQKKAISPYLTEETYNKKEDMIVSYTLQDLLKDIKEDNTIAANAQDLLSLSFEDFLQHQSDFVQLIYNSREEYFGSHDFYYSHILLSPVFKKLTKEEFLKIDKKTLDSCPALFSMSKHLMKDEDIRTLFNDVVQQYHKHPDRVSSGYKPRLELYKNYTFKKHEKELFVSLLKKGYYSDYERIKEYKGFDNFFTKDEYILQHNISGIQYFSEKEIADNLDPIRKGILAAYFKSHYSNIEKIYNLRISKDSFKDIFKPHFVEDIIKISNGFYFHHFDRDNANKTESMNFIHKEVLTLCSNNIELLNMVGFSNCVHNITQIMEHDRSYFDNTYQAAAQNILTHFDTAITTNHLFYNLNEHPSCFSKYDIPKLIINNMQGKESVNYLFALIKISQSTDHWQKKQFTEEINRIIPLLPSQDVVTVSKIFDYKIDTNLLSDNTRQSFDQNFLAFTPDIIKNMHFSTFNSIFNLSNEFRKMVLDNGLDSIIVENKLLNATNNHRDFISTLLNNLKDKKSPYFSFVKSFIKKNKDFMLEHYFNDLVTHPLRNELITIDTKLLEQQSYHKIEVMLDDFSKKSLSYSQLYASREDLVKKEQKKVDALLKTIESEKKSLSDTIHSNFKNISFDFFKVKLEESDTLKSIALYNIANTNEKEYKLILFDKIEALDFETTKSLLNNPHFLNFIFHNKVDTSNSVREKERAVCFNKNFTEEQNINIVETLLKNFNNTDLFIKKYEKNISLSTILYLISDEKRFAISNNLAIKYDMSALFNSYDYLPNKSGYFKKHSTKRYSNEQILEAIQNLNDKGLKIISIPNPNLNHDNLLSYNFKDEAGEEESRKTKVDIPNPYLNDYLSLLTSLENDPINYLACIHSDIVSNFTSDRKWNNKDLAITDFYNSYINTDVVVHAIKDIAAIYKEMMDDPDIYDLNFYKGVAVQNAIKAVSNFIYHTYSSFDNKKISQFEDDKSIKILQTLIKETPYLFFSHSSIGNFSNTDDELTLNFDHYYHKNFISDFFISSYKTSILSDHFSLNYDKKKDYWQSASADQLIVTLIKHLTETRDSENIYQLDFIIKEHKFNNSRPYDKNLREFQSELASFISHKEYEQLIEKSLGYIKMLALTDKLDSKPRIKVKSTKI